MSLGCYDCGYCDTNGTCTSKTSPYYGDYVHPQNICFNFYERHDEEEKGMSGYTYADVIIDPEDPRVEIGKEYYFGDPAAVVLTYAKGDASARILEAVRKGSNHPFTNDIGDYPCIIRKKEPEKKYVPFNLSLLEDREKLRGAWIREKDSGRERSITGLFLDEKPPYVEISDEGYSSEYLLENYEFVDGTPCGKLMEVNE